MLRKSLQPMTKSEVDYLMTRFPDRVPCQIIAAKHSGLKMTNKKFLINRDTKFAEFFQFVRMKNSNLRPDEACFAFAGGQLCSQIIDMGSLWKRHKNAIDILEITIQIESTFG